MLCRCGHFSPCITVHMTQGQGQRPTLMRSPFVKRQTVPRSGFFAFFPLQGPRAVAIWQRVLTSFPYAGADSTCLHQTLIEALSP
jgi:hypothetical protein